MFFSFSLFYVFFFLSFFLSVIFLWFVLVHCTHCFVYSFPLHRAPHIYICIVCSHVKKKNTESSHDAQHSFNFAVHVFTVLIFYCWIFCYFCWSQKSSQSKANLKKEMIISIEIRSNASSHIFAQTNNVANHEHSLLFHSASLCNHKSIKVAKPNHLTTM